MANKIFIILFCMVLLVGSVSAAHTISTTHKNKFETSSFISYDDGNLRTLTFVAPRYYNKGFLWIGNGWKSVDNSIQDCGIFFACDYKINKLPYEVKIKGKKITIIYGKEEFIIKIKEGFIKEIKENQIIYDISDNNVDAILTYSFYENRIDKLITINSMKNLEDYSYVEYFNYLNSEGSFVIDEEIKIWDKEGSINNLKLLKGMDFGVDLDKSFSKISLTKEEIQDNGLVFPIYIDPSLIVTGATSLGGNLTYDWVDFQPGSTVTINATGYLNITATYNITISGTVNGNGLITTASGGSGTQDDFCSGGGGGASHNSTGGAGGTGHGSGCTSGGGGAGSTFDYVNNRTLSLTGRKGGSGTSGGGNGGSFFRIAAPEIKVNGTINLKGSTGSAGGGGVCSGGGAGGGSGGKIVIEGINVEVNDSTMSVVGGSGGTGYYNGGCSGSWQYGGAGGGGGAGGLIAIFFEDSFLNNSLTTSLSGGGGGAHSDSGGGAAGTTNGAAGTVGTYSYLQVADLDLNFPPTVILNSPANNSIGVDSQFFNGTVTDYENALTNVSLILNGIVNETNVSGIEGVYVFEKYLTDGDYNWTYRAFDDANNSVTEELRLLTIDTSYPVIEIVYPTNITYTDNSVSADSVSIDLNWTTYDTNIDKCWYNNETVNVTIACNTNATIILPYGQHTFYAYANDTAGNESSQSITATWQYVIFENETFYNPTTYETSEETFVINITTNGSYTTSAILFYNGISQGASTKTGTDSNANFSNTIQIPTSYVGVKEFLWQVTVGSTLVNTTAINQTVNNLQLDLCNATLTVPYINFTFIDEETLLNINATIDASTWTYWLGDGTATKTLIYSNSTINNFYAFCSSASNDTLHNTRSIQYALAGYPQRKYDALTDLTNSTTNKILYLLSSSDGIYSTIQVVDENGDKISDVEVTAERQFSGVWTVVGEETTDSAGAVTFWVNPDYDHKFTFVSDDCTDISVTVRPTQTQYTQQLQCGAGAEVYVSMIEGIRYSRGPREGIVQPGVHNFTYYITSSKDNIVNASFKIVNSSSDVVLNSTFSSCAPGGCLIHFVYNVTGGDDIKGKYYVDIGNGTFLLEGDAHWVCIEIPTAGKTGMSTFFKDIIYVLNEWGDESETADFNRLVVVFFFMCLSISFLNYHFNIDVYPGALLLGVTLFVWLGSLVGGTTSQGLFYFNNLVTGDAFSDTAKNIINNYLLAFLCSIQTGTFFLVVNKRAQQ